MSANSTRIDRIANEMQIQLSKLISQEMKDPRLGIITITSVEVSRDLAHAKIYIVVRDEKTADLTLQILNKAAGFLRHHLGKLIDLRILPSLHFYYDTSSQYGRHIDELLKDLPPEE